jgi:threonine dehydrogenase-like Zn-dependent dehydrogenase
MTVPGRSNSIMRAAVFHGNDRITIERVAMPAVASGEVLVRVLRTALCGSDFKLWHKGAEFTAGHEIFGVVEQPGHAMHGKRCAVYIPLHCDRCAACKRGDTQMCLEVSSLIGWNRPGGYAQYVPVPENCLLPVPDDIEDSLAPLLLDVIGTGAGPVGLGVVLALKSMGYHDIRVSDPNVMRLKIAQAFGARPHPVGDTSQRFALIIECSGAHAARNLGIEVVLPRGALVLVGENAAPWTIEEGKVFRRKDFYMIRTFYFPIADFAPNIDLLRRYRDEYRVLVDGEFGLSALPQNFARFAAGELIKPVLALD